MRVEKTEEKRRGRTQPGGENEGWIRKHDSTIAEINAAVYSTVRGNPQLWVHNTEGGPDPGQRRGENRENLTSVPVCALAGSSSFMKKPCSMARETHPTMLAAYMHSLFGQLEGGGCENLWEGTTSPGWRIWGVCHYLTNNTERTHLQCAEWL